MEIGEGVLVSLPTIRCVLHGDTQIQIQIHGRTPCCCNSMKNITSSLSAFRGEINAAFEVDLNFPSSTSTMDSNTALIEPSPGMEFESHENAYSFYRDYAKAMGFGTAKLSSRRSRASKEFIDAKFSCTRYGTKQQSDDAVNPRPSPKIGCKASMHVKRKQNGKWYVYSFVQHHNHDLLPSQVHLFRSHRNTDPLNNDVRMRRRKNLAAVSNLFGAYQNVDCLESYVKNQHDKGRTLVLESGDVQILLQLFMYRQQENPKFFYAVDLNEEHQLRNVFWVDSKGMEDYAHFGDVVSLDTTYFTHKYKLPLVLFIGVNHHIQPTLLGCALIADDTVYTFLWLIQTWYIAMGERAPKVMLTDQNTNIKAVIEAVLPGTCHHFCLWYIFEKIPKNLEFLSMWDEDFMEEFKKCIFKSWTKEQFEKRWHKLLEGFNLREVEWLQSLYDDRAYWVPAFTRDVSFAGLCTSTRMESLNSSFDKYVQIETSLMEFIERYRDILEEQYEEEAKANFDAWHETPELKSPSPFEKQISSVYTHEILKRFQVEVLGAAACHFKKETEDETTATFTVKDIEDGQNYVVECGHSNSDIYCSCRSFEYKGFLCRHAIIVLQMSGVFSIPSKYILQRWTNTAMSRNPINEKLDEVQCKVRRFNDLCRRAIILGEEGSLSQESYDIALSAINEALKQCATVSRSSSAENDVRPDTAAVLVFGIEEGNQCSNLAVDNAPDLEVINAKKNPKRAGSSKELAANEISKNGKISQPLGTKAGTQDEFNHMELSDMRPIQLHNMVPTLLHNVTPTTTTQFHCMPPAQFHENRLPR